VDGAMRGPLAHEHDEPLDPEPLAGRVGDRDVTEVRRVEGASEQP